LLSGAPCSFPSLDPFGKAQGHPEQSRGGEERGRGEVADDFAKKYQNWSVTASMRESNRLRLSA